MRSVLRFVIFGLCTISLRADIHYVRAGAANGNNGTDWTNAWTELPEDLVRGDTYYIADGTYGPYWIDDAESGTAYIYIKKATASDHGTDTGWDPAYGDGQAVFEDTWDVIKISVGYIDIDGQTGQDTTGHGFKFQAYDLANYTVSIFDNTWTGRTISNINLRHCEIAHRGSEIFVNEGEFTVNTGDNTINVTDASRYNPNGTNTIKVHSTGALPSGLVEGEGYYGTEYYVKNVITGNNTVQLSTDYDGADIVQFSDQGTGTHTFQVRRGGACLKVSSAQMTNGIVQYCYFHDSPLWFVNPGNASGMLYEHNFFARNHSDSFSHGEAFQANSQTINTTLRYCTFKDIEGTAFIVASGYWEVYGNLFYFSSTYPNGGQSGSGVGHGVLTTNTDIYGHMLFYNNTVYNINRQGEGAYSTVLLSGTGNQVFNNIFVACGYSRWGTDPAAVHYDYNYYYDFTNDGGYLDGLTAQEPHSVAGDAVPFLDAEHEDFRLAYAVLAGTTLAYPYDCDMTGSARGTDGNWDVGALEYTANPIRPRISDSGMPISPRSIPNPVHISDIGPTLRITDLYGTTVSKATVAQGLYIINTETGPVRRIILTRR